MDEREPLLTERDAPMDEAFPFGLPPDLPPDLLQIDQYRDQMLALVDIMGPAKRLVTPQRPEVIPDEGEEEWQIRNCTVCWEDYRQCPHECLPCDHAFCRDCMQGYIAARIDELELVFTCPDRNCTDVIPHEAIARHINTLWPQFHKAKRLNRQHNSVRCPRCKHRVLRQREDLGEGLPGGAAVRFKCPNEECGAIFCLRCGENYRGHEGVACIDHSKSKRTLRERFWLKFKRVKPCPNCLIFVVKDGGCDWVKCAQCSHEFCWSCLFPHSHSNHTHRWGITEADVLRHDRKIKAAKVVGVAGAVAAAPAVIVVGGALAIVAGVIVIPAAAVVLPVLGVHKCCRVRRQRAQYVTLDY